MLQGFKKFILRGNVVDLAVGVVIGAAFSKVVSGFTGDFITPLLTFFGGTKGGWAANSWTLGFGHKPWLLHGHPLVLAYGDFVVQMINFLITAAVLYFLVVLPINKLTELRHKNEPTPDPTTRKCPECLSEIPIKAIRCSFCTSKVKPLSSKAGQSA